VVIGRQALAEITDVLLFRGIRGTGESEATPLWVTPIQPKSSFGFSTTAP
jgi:hypothetical protein